MTIDLTPVHALVAQWREPKTPKPFLTAPGGTVFPLYVTTDVYDIIRAQCADELAAVLQQIEGAQPLRVKQPPKFYYEDEAEVPDAENGSE